MLRSRVFTQIAAASASAGFLRNAQRFGSSRVKVTSVEDAVHLVPNGATVTVAGFVGQGCAEEICAALAKRFEQTGEPNGLTLVFGGGPGDWDKRGLNHFAKKGMLKRRYWLALRTGADAGTSRS